MPEPTPTIDQHALQTLPYRIAVLCYLYDGEGRVLMLHRAKAPNADMYSPIGGKLEASVGEGPHDCAIREIEEEAGITLQTDQVRLVGMVSETAYEGQTHWLIFLFEVERPIGHGEISQMDFDEGRLEWVPVEAVEDRPIPETDRRIMWPLVRANRGAFFAAHIDCSVEPMRWELHEGRAAPGMGEPGMA